MKIPENMDRNVIALATALVIFLLFLVAYLFPRLGQLKLARESIRALTTTRQEVSVLLPQVARTAFTTPVPPENVRSWVGAEALKGIDADKQLVANDGYLEGKGAQVKLRRLTPAQAAGFLSSLTRVRLVVDRMSLQDSDGDGKWDMEISLKVPEVTTK